MPDAEDVPPDHDQTTDRGQVYCRHRDDCPRPGDDPDRDGYRLPDVLPGGCRGGCYPLRGGCCLRRDGMIHPRWDGPNCLHSDDPNCRILQDAEACCYRDVHSDYCPDGYCHGCRCPALPKVGRNCPLRVGRTFRFPRGVEACCCPGAHSGCCPDGYCHDCFPGLPTDGHCYPAWTRLGNVLTMDGTIGGYAQCENCFRLLRDDAVHQPRVLTWPSWPRQSLQYL